MAETWDIIDEQDNVIRQVSRVEARKLNLMHRSITVFIFNSKGEILINKRTDTKDIYPGYYDIGCGGGVSTGEIYEQGALRELEEEFGIKNHKLEFLFNTRYKSDLDNIINYVYKVIYDGEIILQEEEVVSYEFISIEELNKLIEKEKFCLDSVEMYKKFRQELL